MEDVLLNRPGVQLEPLRLKQALALLENEHLYSTWLSVAEELF